MIYFENLITIGYFFIIFFKFKKKIIFLNNDFFINLFCNSKIISRYYTNKLKKCIKDEKFEILHFKVMGLKEALDEARNELMEVKNDLREVRNELMEVKNDVMKVKTIIGPPKFPPLSSDSGSGDASGGGSGSEGGDGSGSGGDSEDGSGSGGNGWD